jgi:hypothetical protein
VETCLGKRHPEDELGFGHRGRHVDPPAVPLRYLRGDMESYVPAKERLKEFALLFLPSRLQAVTRM